MGLPWRHREFRCSPGVRPVCWRGQKLEWLGLGLGALLQDPGSSSWPLSSPEPGPPGSRQWGPSDSHTDGEAASEIRSRGRGSGSGCEAKEEARGQAEDGAGRPGGSLGGGGSKAS